MSSNGAVATATLTVTCASVALTVAIVLIKIFRHRREARSLAAIAPHRRDLIAIATGEDPEGISFGRIRDLTTDEWQRIASAVVTMLNKVRAEPAGEIIALLSHHGEIDRARTQIGSRSQVVRARGAHLLGLVQSEFDVPGLTLLLRDRSSEVRLAAARALGMIGDVASAGPVLDCVGAQHGIAGVPVHIAADALSCMGVGIAPILNSRLTHPDPGIRQAATMVAGEGTFVSASLFLVSLVDDDPEIDVRISAAHALGMIGSPAQIPTLLRHLGKGEPPGLRRACVQALGLIASPQAVEPLGNLLVDPDRRLATLAAESLVALGQRGFERLTAEMSTNGSFVARGALATAALASGLASRRAAG